MKFNNCTNKTSANQHGKCPLGAPRALVCALNWKFFFHAGEEFETHFSMLCRFSLGFALYIFLQSCVPVSNFEQQ
jgi:hypothetical protein